MIARTGTRSEETSVKDKHLQAVLEKASRDWHEEANVEDKWSAVRSGRHQPDWFWESLSSLKPLLEVRNAAYSRWLGSGRQTCLRRFREGSQLPKTWASKGPRRRCRDLAKKDLTAVEVGKDWYNVAQDRNMRSAA